MVEERDSPSQPSRREFVSFGASENWFPEKEEYASQETEGNQSKGDNRLLEKVMDEGTVGDPISPLKWNSRSTYQIRSRKIS
jgi:hypothetical protein